MRFTMGCKRSEKRAKLLTLSHDLNNIRVGYVRIGHAHYITKQYYIFWVDRPRPDWDVKNQIATDNKMA